MTDNWYGNWRRDGAKVVQNPLNGKWIVIAGDDRSALTKCPCCGMQLPDARTAKRVADKAMSLSYTPTAKVTAR